MSRKIFEVNHTYRPKPKISLTQGNAAYDSLTQGTIDRAVKEIFI